jgi:hypothetical protein
LRYAVEAADRIAGADSSSSSITYVNKYSLSCFGR